MANEHSVIIKAVKYNNARHRKKRWYRLLSVLAAFVVFITTYALILPAITMQKEVICGFTEHTHSDECYAENTVIEYNCNYEKHKHSNDCYNEMLELVCGYSDFCIHSHADACYLDGNLVCDLGEHEVHEHSDACYRTVMVAIGGNDSSETQEELLTDEISSEEESSVSENKDETSSSSSNGLVATEEKILICEKTEIYLHTHSDACFDEETKELICEKLQTVEHEHADECFSENKVSDERVLICALQEHVHDEELCFGQTSDSQETPEEWESTLPENLSGVWADDLVLVALSQLGYKESNVSYYVDEQGTVRGYTRYGDWNENPYGDWNTFFVNFCLHYAGIPENVAPYAENPNAMISAWATKELFSGARTVTPAKGDVVFLDTDNNGVCDTIGIVSVAGNDIISYVAGDITGEVKEQKLKIADVSILGYGCMTDVVALMSTPSDMERIENVISMIDALPSYEEIASVLENESEENDEYYFDVMNQYKFAYSFYEDLGPLLRESVPNAEKLLSMQWLWTSTPLVITDSITIYQVNSYSQAYSLISYGSSSSSFTAMSFTYWKAYVIEQNDSGQLYLASYHASGPHNSRKATTANGFVIITQETINANVGDLVSVSFDYKSKKTYTAQGHGTVSFGESVDAGAQKPAKDNSSMLSIIPSADTKELIEVNLYNYGANINDLWLSNKKYPGFQQHHGEHEGTYRYHSNFGDNIVADYDAGDNSITNQGGAINATGKTADGKNNINIPVFGVMSPTLINGFPALSDGTSLDYLFKNSTYAVKVNADSINGLFQYNETTGAYFYNSRVNHAQYDDSTESFTLYDEIITPNHTFYPFGNFLPFNDIVHKAQRFDKIDKTYYNTLVQSAKYKALNGFGDEYTILADSLVNWMAAMDKYYPSGWQSDETVESYFNIFVDDKSFDFDTRIDAGYKAENGGKSLWDHLYTIDYDEETDFFFGMDMSMKFMMPEDGYTGIDGKQPMVYEFTGDDDVWVYIDGVLFLELTGIHRHVGGKIDFTKGEVYYYELLPDSGDVSGEPYKTVKFSDLLGSDAKLNANGTFETYSLHTLNFYYMERGSGSGVCRMNFNFPLLKRNSISIGKKLSADGDITALGNPDFNFQIYKTGTTELLIGEGYPYTITDGAGNKIGEGVTGPNGVVAIKAGQVAVIEGIPENAGDYYVREILQTDVFEQYGEIIVDGSSYTKDTYEDIIVDTDEFKGVSSAVESMQNGSTIFSFDNFVDTTKYGQIKIKKILNDDSIANKQTKMFDVEVLIDGVPIPENYPYTLTRANGQVVNATVFEEGRIFLKADEVITISGILAGSKVSVREFDTSSIGYTVSYVGENIKLVEKSVDGETYYHGIVPIRNSGNINIINDKNGTKLHIPVRKTMRNYDGLTYTYNFTLREVVSPEDLTFAQIGKYAIASQTVNSETTDFGFTLIYPPDPTSVGTHYYLIWETDAQEGTGMDTNKFIVEVESEMVGSEIQSRIVSIKDLNGETVPQVEFVNETTKNLQISKIVERTDSPDAIFTFIVELKNGDTPIPGSYYYEKGNGDSGLLEFDENGRAEFELGHLENVTLFGIPIGTTWTVTEVAEKGYKTTYKVLNTEIVGNTNSLSAVLTEYTHVEFTNAQYYELPATGATTYYLYTFAWVMLIISAIFILLYKLFLHKKKDTATS